MTHAFDSLPPQTQPKPSRVIIDRVLGRAGRGVELTNFFFQQRVAGFSISDAPEFEGEAISYFEQSLSIAKRYLEFGSGGSSIVAARLGKPFTSVESDKFFLAALRRKLHAERLANDANQTFIHVDIGLTEKWGAPVLKRPSSERVARWRSYANAPWRPGAQRPDLILIDGRFRVCCALTAIRNLGNNSDWSMLVDDYVGRDYYHVIARFAELRALVGRLAVFGPPKAINFAALDEEILRATADYR